VSASEPAKTRTASGVLNPSQSPYFSVIHGILGQEILLLPMRKLCLLLLASLLLLPAAALAELSSPSGGSLVLSNASARVTVSGHGLIFGHLDRGSITVVGDYKPDDNSALSSVSGARMKFTGGNVVYSGSDVRFLFPGGRYTLIVDGYGIDLSAVGNGKLSAVGRGLPDDGTVTIDGGPPQSIDAVDVLSYGRSGKGRNG
jgi:hypothetical protein